MTQDTRQWTRRLPDAPKDGCELTMPAPGKYGFIVRPVSGVHRAMPEPRPLDKPQIWVLFDETKPDVRITGVTPGEGDKDGTITVRWVARDKWMAEKPITILCAASKDAKDEEWKVLGSDLPDTGSYEAPKETVAALLKDGMPYQFYVRVEAVDRAGNVGRDTTADTVKVDTKVPKATEITTETKGTAKAAGSPDEERPVHAAEPRVIHVRKKTFAVRYKVADVGPSGVKCVEVWMTQDGEQWSRYRTNAPVDPRDGYRLTAPKEGRYGFTMRPISGAMRAKKEPGPLDQPQLWVEVRTCTSRPSRSWRWRRTTRSRKRPMKC
jgi:hypothetical protein